jgi:2-iminobutanoate/2-iminopropanoate deaminase
MARLAIHIPGLVHENPIPVACLNGPQLATGLISPLTPGTGEIPEAIEERVANLVAHMAAILEAAGTTWDAVTKINFYVSDNAIRPVINAWWVTQFPDPHTRPARHTSVIATRGDVACDFLGYVAG